MNMNTEQQLALWNKSLDPKERIMHDLAVKMLGSRYDASRCNSFLKWVAKQPKVDSLKVTPVTST